MGSQCKVGWTIVWITKVASSRGGWHRRVINSNISATSKLLSKLFSYVKLTWWSVVTGKTNENHVSTPIYGRNCQTSTDKIVMCRCVMCRLSIVMLLIAMLLIPKLNAYLSSYFLFEPNRSMQYLKYLLLPEQQFKKNKNLSCSQHKKLNSSYFVVSLFTKPCKLFRLITQFLFIRYLSSTPLTVKLVFLNIKNIWK